jgi:hypothetical protein
MARSARLPAFELVCGRAHEWSIWRVPQDQAVWPAGLEVLMGALRLRSAVAGSWRQPSPLQAARVIGRRLRQELVPAAGSPTITEITLQGPAWPNGNGPPTAAGSWTGARSRSLSGRTADHGCAPVWDKGGCTRPDRPCVNRVPATERLRVEPGRAGHAKRTGSPTTIVDLRRDHLMRSPGWPTMSSPVSAHARQPSANGDRHELVFGHAGHPAGPRLRHRFSCESPSDPVKGILMS